MTQTADNRKFNLETATREELVERINKLERALARYREQAADYHWLRTLIRNKTYSGNEKAILYATREVTATQEPRQDGYVQVYREDIAKVAGVSEDTVGKTIKSLAEHNIMGRKIEPARDKETGQVTKNLLIQLPQQFDPSVKKELKPDESGWGGKRVKVCPTCKGTDLLEKHYYVCQNPECGCIIQLDEVLEVSEEALAKDAKLQEDLQRIAAEKEAAAAAYPQEIMAMMDAQGIRRLDHRACLICQHKEWLPALKGDTWHYDCGYCHPFLLASQGRDLRKREGIA